MEMSNSGIQTSRWQDVAGGMAMGGRRLFCGMCPLLFILVIAVFGMAGPPKAFGGKCAQCGCESSCQRVCRLVEADRKVTTTCWGYECEEFCVPGPSKRGCQHGETVCGECERDSSEVHAKPQRLVWSDWSPACFAKRFTKAKLMKKTESKTVKGYEWMVEELCLKCEKQCAKVEMPSDASLVPPIPDQPGRLLAPTALVERLEDREAGRRAGNQAARNDGVLLK